MATAPAVTKLRQLLADESKIIVCPGVYDGFTARIALQEGFDALYMVGTTPITASWGSIPLLTLVVRQEQAPRPRDWGNRTSGLSR